MCAYFKEIHEQMKRENPGCNYFTVVSEIRTKYEGTPKWQDYLTWVRSKHPNRAALTKDPRPRKNKNVVTTTSSLLSDTGSTIRSKNGRNAREKEKALVNSPINKVTKQPTTLTRRSENGKKSRECSGKFL